MNWYLAKIVYQIICGSGEHTPQFDEQLRLIEADDEDMAFEKARATGYREEETFYNINQQLVRWEFVNVSELYRLHTLMDGAELYSRITEADDGPAYISFVHRKAEALKEKQARELLQLI